ncbi:TPA: hypothetical protein ACY3LZ_005223 [Citrobacter freundii]|uniref:Bacteriophage protein n=1 Tax=Citrobacter portucalensis TaxID=1639133 RepID=A0AAW5WFP2_9ENTR|nr:MULTISPECIES: hypothetical protein [Citrobacter freundii complex]ECZ1980049.1 hypothetical protein [Salmonella enterica]MCX9004591.1 hypothetical protein [Citrobacter portucalensis]MDK2581794.1 hypothetical protein [Citrobacter portucalensis]RVR97607.1 hypothetical protein EOL15_24855 [Citrobacter freundii]HAK6590654.1 hypothetical protein [Salmonella enterica]
MELIYKTRKEFLDLQRMGAFTRVVATQDKVTKCWRLFGLNENGIAVFIEKTRGGVREWSGLNYVADFCSELGIRVWEVHMPGAKLQK